MGKVSGKTHTKEQLDNWANQHNPNNKAYKANADNHSNQKNPKQKLIRQYTTRTAETKCRVGVLNGHLIIQNTMIK